MRMACMRLFQRNLDMQQLVTCCKTWMTAELFADFLKKFHKRSGHVLLLLDNASNHSQGYLTLTNVTLEFLPTDTSSHFQAMNTGIIQNLKDLYKLSIK